MFLWKLIFLFPGSLLWSFNVFLLNKIFLKILYQNSKSEDLILQTIFIIFLKLFLFVDKASWLPHEQRKVHAEKVI